MASECGWSGCGAESARTCVVRVAVVAPKWRVERGVSAREVRARGESVYFVWCERGGAWMVSLP